MRSSAERRIDVLVPGESRDKLTSDPMFRSNAVRRAAHCARNGWVRARFGCQFDKCTGRRPHRCCLWVSLELRDEGLDSVVDEFAHDQRCRGFLDSLYVQNSSCDTVEVVGIAGDDVNE